MRIKAIFLFLLFLPVGVNSSMGQNFERFFAAALLNNLPNPLINVVDQKWPGGTFSLSIHRDDNLVISTAADQMIGTVPLKVDFKGKVNRDLVFTQVNFDCTSEFETDSAVEMVFAYQNDRPDVTSKIYLPIPPVEVNCGDFAVPVQTLLQEVIDRQIPEWQLLLDAAIEAELAKLL